MFRLVRFAFSCLALFAILWFAVTVPLGKRTLWGHLVNIARTEEARDLATGARDTAIDVAKRVDNEIHAGPDGPPMDQKKKKQRKTGTVLRE